VWGVGKPDMADAEGGVRRSRWVSNDYAAFGAMFTASLVIRWHFPRVAQRAVVAEEAGQ
jgi:hypothetical protein